MKTPPLCSYKASPEGREFITRFEGCKLLAYRCAAGVPTVGIGHTKGVQMGDVVTREQADYLLTEDLRAAEGAVSNLVKVPLEQCQADALISFVFNLGTGNFAKSTLLKRLNDGDKDAAADEILRWSRAGGQVVQGLVKRRIAERILFLSGRYS